MNVLHELRNRFRSALEGLGADPALAAMVKPAQDSRFGDYQANCAMPLAKLLGVTARDVAAQIVERLSVADLCESPEIAGPGFINLKLKTDWLVPSTPTLWWPMIGWASCPLQPPGESSSIIRRRTSPSRCTSATCAARSSAMLCTES